MVEVLTEFLTDMQVVNLNDPLLSHFVLCGLCQRLFLIVHFVKEGEK
jgi:hypothetical protein